MNEIKSVVNGNYNEVGDITILTTTNKTNVVSAINEVNQTNVNIYSLSSSQSIAKSTFVKVGYDTSEIYGDTFTTNTNGTIKFTKAGKYLILINTIYEVNASGGRYHDLWDGSSGYALGGAAAATGIRTCLSSNTIFNISGGEEYYTRAFQSTSGNLNVMAGSSITIIKL